MRSLKGKLLAALAIAAGTLSILLLPFVVMGPAHAIECGDTKTTCFDNLIIGGSTVLTSATITRLDSTTVVSTAVDVALTSPTVTFSAAGKYLINLSSSANQTGIYPLNGTLNQELLIIAANGAGTNTMQFTDNASTMSLGSNRVLTEGNNSVIKLICRTAGARPQWASEEFQAN